MGLGVNVENSPLIFKGWTILMVVLLGAVTGLHLIDFLQVQFWRHDSVYYLSSYGLKLEGEGRWLNYYVFSWLKLVPAWLSILLSYGAIGYFAYSCSYRLNRDVWFSVLLALATSNIPLLRMQLEWPTTLLPAFLLLWLAPWFSRRVPEFVFFLVYGLLLFGSFSSLYFLLPFLYLPGATIKSFVRTLFLWMVCFVLGYLVSQAVVWKVTGEFITVAGWRHPNPVDNVATFIANLQASRTYVRSHALFMVNVFSFWLLLLSLVWSLFGGSPLRRILVWGAALVVFLAPYVTALPYGIVVSGRTAFIGMMALLLALFLHERTNLWYRASGALLLMSVGFSMSQMTSAYTQWYKGMTDAMVMNVRQSMPLPPDKTDKVYILIDDTQWRRFTDWIVESESLSSPRMFSEGFVSTHYRRSLLVSLGYYDVVVCGAVQLGACEVPLQFAGGEAVREYSVYAQVVEGKSILLSMPDPKLPRGIAPGL